jgi:tRNA1Val (adenine37-N6)-methyltransferase
MQEESNQQAALCREVGSSIDGRLLADFVDPAPGERLAELGSGCGEVSIQVAMATTQVVVDGLEIQPDLVEIACSRLVSSQVSERVRMITGDVRSPPEIMLPAAYDHVFSNPPFFKVGEGRLPPDPSRAQARFEQAGGVADFIGCGARLLRSGGLFHLVHRPERLLEIFAEFSRAGFYPFRMIPVQDRVDTPAVLILIAARKGVFSPLVLEPAWIISQNPAR